MGTPPQPDLPPGFRFHPTDEELIFHYLMKKVASVPLPVSIIADVDIYKFDPWELPAKAAFGEKEWYFFSPRARKYPNGARPNRAASSGYWKATGTDKTIVASSLGGGVRDKNIGVKKGLVFYRGKAPKGVKTNWIMHEYRLVDNSNRPIKLKESSMRLDDWVLCRIYRRSKFTLSPKIEAATVVGEQDQAEEKVFKDTLFPFSKGPPPQNTLISQKSVSFSNPWDAMDYPLLSRFLSYENSNSNNPPGFGSSSGFNCGNLDQQFFQSNNNTSNSYLLLKNSQLNPSVPYMENIDMRPKRQLSNIDEDPLHPSKQYLSSSCNTNAISENPQWNFLLKQSLLNQQLLRFHR